MKIPKEEFMKRIENIQQAMVDRNLDGLAVYGDEYRKENLRYVSNFWPIFERGMCFIPRKGNPVLAGAPEGEQYAREMSICEDIRNVKEFACVSVTDEIEYSLATFSSFKEIVSEVLSGGKRLGLVGYWDMPSPILQRLKDSVPGLELIEADEILSSMRLIKSSAEIACLRTCGDIAGKSFLEIMKKSIPGNTELEAAAAGEALARKLGAEAINFHVYGSGERTHTIIGRPTDKIIKESEMIMSALAVQYEGYVTTVEYPFVAGKATHEQKQILNVLFEAANVQQQYLKDGVKTGAMVKAVKKVYRDHGFEQYDIYPPMHGIGLAEAEAPYPDVNSEYQFRKSMCVNSDISLFGSPGGSNRIEEGFVITAEGSESLTPVIRKLLAESQL